MHANFINFTSFTNFINFITTLRYCIAILFFLLAASARAQAVLTLDLFQSIRIATDSSLQAFSAKNMYLSRYWQFRSFTAGCLPSLNLAMTPLQYNRDIVKRYDYNSNADVYREQQSLYLYGNLSLRQNVALTGGTLYVDSELGYLHNYGEAGYSQYSSVPVRIGYSQNLFGFNSLKWEKKIEPLKFEKAKKQLLYAREAISEQTISLFFTLAMAQTEYEMAQSNVTSADTLYKIGAERLKIAAISQADLLTLKLDAVNAVNSLKTAELNLKRTMFNFAAFLNMEMGTPIRVTLPQQPVSISIDAEAALVLAQQNNPDFFGYQQELLEAEREVNKTSRALLFDASLNVSIGFNQVSDRLPGAYRDPLQQDVARIGLTVPIVDWGVRKGQVNMAKNNRNVAQLSVQQQKSALEQDVIITVTDFSIQKNLVAGAEEALKLAMLAYESTKQRFMIGKADISSLTLSLNRLNSAQRGYISALSSYWQSYYKIRKLTLYDFESGENLADNFDKFYGFSE
jgi:outer membrane protein TolC